MPNDATAESGRPVSFDQVFERIRSRQGGDPAESYVASLFAKGEDALLQKIGEESCELLLAAKNASAERGEGPARAAAIHELTDLWFHLMVWMAASGFSLDDVRGELGARFGRPGLRRGATTGSTQP
jgi:phosphoribosyl-ATP pyrophosphohydrolase